MRKIMQYLASGKYAPIDTGNSPRQIQSLLMDSVDGNNVLKIIMYTGNKNGLSCASAAYNNLVNVYEALKDKPYVMCVYSVEQDSNNIIIESKKYKELDRDSPIWNHYTAEYLIERNLLKKTFDILYDLWKSGIYLPDRFPSRNICLDENDEMVLIDLDIHEGEGFQDKSLLAESFYDSEYVQKYIRSFPQDFIIANNWFIGNEGCDIGEYYE